MSRRTDYGNCGDCGQAWPLDEEGRLPRHPNAERTHVCRGWSHLPSEQEHMIRPCQPLGAR